MQYIVIMAGGEGTRLWPISRKKSPKQVQPFLHTKETLLQKTYKRVRKGFRPEQIYVTTMKPYYGLIKKQLPELPTENISIEPEKKDTAPAIGLIATIIKQKNPKATITTVGSDAYIEDEKEYIKIIKLANKLSQNKSEYTILVGINPSYPETGYGYIQMDKPIAELNKHEVFTVKKFIEKPDYKVAEKFLQKWEYLWNPALFTWRVETLLSLYQKYLPQIYKRLSKIEKYLNQKNKGKLIEEEYKKMPKLAIEFGILEKTKKLMVIPADFGWADIGHWRAIKNILTKNSELNLVKGEHIGVDTKDNLIYGLSKRLIATAGLRDIIIVDTPDALLICTKDKAHMVKDIIKEIEKKGKQHLL